MATFEEMLANPENFFNMPIDIYHHEEFTDEQKIKLLQQWEYDLKLLQTAEEENMPESDGQHEKLNEIKKALHLLGADTNPPGQH